MANLDSILGCGGGSLTDMGKPYIPAFSTYGLVMKASAATIYSHDNSSFWSKFASPAGSDANLNSYQQYVNQSWIANSTVHQVNLFSGPGVLTHVLTPRQLQSGWVRIFLTVDDVRYSYKIQVGANYRGCLGGFRQTYTTTSSSDIYSTNQLGQYQDTGWGNPPETLMTSPRQTLDEGIGIPFKESLKVEIQMQDFMTISASTYLANCGIVVAKYEN